MEKNGAIYARLVNRTYEVVCQATGNVKNIDKEKPNEAEISFNSNTILEGGKVVVTVKQSDRGVSGIDITNCKYVFTESNTPIGTEDVTQYTGGTFTKEEEQLTLNCPKTENYFHVLTVDNAGNKIETIILEPVKVTKLSDIINNTQKLNEVINNSDSLNDILNNNNALSSLISNANSFRTIANNRDAFAKICENANARQYMYNNYSVTESIIQSSSTALSVMKQSSRYAVLGANLPANRVFGNIYSGPAFVFSISQSTTSQGQTIGLQSWCYHHGNYLNGGYLEQPDKSVCYGSTGLAFGVNRFASSVQAAFFNHYQGGGYAGYGYAAIFKI